MWTIEFHQNAVKELRKLDSHQAKLIVDWLDKRIKTGADPRLFAEQLTGNFNEFWRFRIGDFRIIFKIEDEKLCILVVRIAHRREVYNV